MQYNIFQSLMGQKRHSGRPGPMSVITPIVTAIPTFGAGRTATMPSQVAGIGVAL